MNMTETTRDTLLTLVAYGDSLSMPRAHENIRCDQTYAELIRQWYESAYPWQKVCLYNRAQGGTDIGTQHRAFQRDCEYFGKTGQKVLLMQCGVIDCAPRPMPWWVRNQLSKLPGQIRNPVTTFLHNHRASILNMGLRWRATSPFLFQEVYRHWLSQAAETFTRVYVFTITPATQTLDTHSPGLNKSIVEYNGYIRNAVKSCNADNLFLIDLYALLMADRSKFDAAINTKDGYHITHEGHKFFSEQVIALEMKYYKERAVSMPLQA